GDRFPRFQEIRRQAFGVLAATTSDAVVRESLGITEDQRLKFNAQREELLGKIRERMKQAMGKGKGKGKRTEDAADSTAENTAKNAAMDDGMRDFASQEEKLFVSLLTEQQAAKWKELLGAPIEIPSEVIRFVRRNRYEPASEGDRPGDQPSKGGSKRE